MSTVRAKIQAWTQNRLLNTSGLFLCQGEGEESEEGDAVCLAWIADDKVRVTIFPSDDQFVASLFFFFLFLSICFFFSLLSRIEEERERERVGVSVRERIFVTFIQGH